MAARVLEHRKTEPERPGSLTPPLRQEHPQVLEPAGQQGLLIGEVRIEGRPSDVGAIDDVLNRRRVVPLLDHHRKERILQQLTRALHPSVQLFRLGHCASTVPKPNEMPVTVSNRRARAATPRCQCPYMNTMFSKRYNVNYQTHRSGVAQ